MKKNLVSKTREPGVWSSRTIEGLVRAFNTQTLPREEWTHEAHLIVGMWFVSKHGEDATIYLLRKRIKAYNESIGIPNTEQDGYHETMTVFWVRLIGQYFEQKNGDLDTKTNSFLRSPFADKNLWSRFYSRERIFSPEARKRWIPPDLTLQRLNFVVSQY